MTISGKRSGVLAAMVLAMLIPASGCQLVPEIFNEDIFLSAIDMESGTQNQARPEDENLIRLNFNNRLEHTVVLTVLVHRPSRIETVKWTLYGRSTVGQFLTNCQNDPPSLIRLQFLGEDQSVELPEEMFFPDAYVFVNGEMLFDRDGTLVHDVPYNADPARVRALVDHVHEVSARLRG